MQVVCHLLTWGYRFVDVNSTNSEGKTAWDILQGQTQDNSEIRVMLRDAKAKPASSLSTFNSHPNNQRPPYSSRCLVYWRTNVIREIGNLTMERRNTLLVAAVLLATLSFQVLLTPPGGVWQDNGECVNLTEGLGSSHHNGSKHLTPFNITTLGSSNYPVIMHLTRSNTTVACEHKAGTAVAMGKPLFFLCLLCSWLTFNFSNALLALLALFPAIDLSFVALHLTLSFSYSYSFVVIMDYNDLVMIISICSAEILLLALALSFIFSLFRRVH